MNDCKTRSGRAFDRQAWTYDTARFGSHARGLYPVLLEQLAQIPHGSVLDVGCGTGELLREVGLRFPETARTGLDLSANMLAVAREKLGGAVELVQGDAERLPFADGRFEVLLCPTRARRRRSLPGCSSPAACSCWETARPRRG